MEVPLVQCNLAVSIHINLFKPARIEHISARVTLLQFVLKHFFEFFKAGIDSGVDSVEVSAGGRKIGATGVACPLL